MDPQEFITLLARPEVRLALQQATSAPTSGIQKGPSAGTSGIQNGPSAPASGLQKGPSAPISGQNNDEAAPTSGIENGPQDSGESGREFTGSEPEASGSDRDGYKGHERFRREVSPGLHVHVGREFSEEEPPSRHGQGKGQGLPEYSSPPYRVRPRALSLGHRDTYLDEQYDDRADLRYDTSRGLSMRSSAERASDVRERTRGRSHGRRRERGQDTSASDVDVEGDSPRRRERARVITKTHASHGHERSRSPPQPRRRPTARRRRSPSRSSDSESEFSGTSSDSDTSRSVSPAGRREDRDFDPTKLGDKDRWCPPPHIADFLRNNARRSLSKKQRTEMRKMCPFPAVEEAQCPILDNFVKDLPNLGFGRKADKSMAALQGRICDVFAPLAAAWTAVEAGRPDKELIQLLQVAMAMVGDASNALSISRRQRLTGQLPNKCPTSLLRETAPAGHMLFGEDFTKKYKRRTQEIESFKRTSGAGRQQAGHRSSSRGSRGRNGGYRGESRSDHRFKPYEQRQDRRDFRDFSHSKNGRGGNRPFRGRGRGH